MKRFAIAAIALACLVSPALAEKHCFPLEDALEKIGRVGVADEVPAEKANAFLNRFNAVDPKTDFTGPVYFMDDAEDDLTIITATEPATGLTCIFVAKEQTRTNLLALLNGEGM